MRFCCYNTLKSRNYIKRSVVTSEPQTSGLFSRSSFSCKRTGSGTALQPCFQLAWTAWCTVKLARCLGVRECKKHLSSTLVFTLPTPSFSHFTSDLLQPSAVESDCVQVLLRSGAGVGVSLLPSPPSLAMPHFPLLKRTPLPAAFPSHSNMAVLTCKWQALAHEDAPLSETSWELLVNKMQMKYANSRFFCKTDKEISFIFCLIGLRSLYSVLVNSLCSTTWIRTTCVWSIQKLYDSLFCVYLGIIHTRSLKRCEKCIYIARILKIGNRDSNMGN